MSSNTKRIIIFVALIAAVILTATLLTTSSKAAEIPFDSGEESLLSKIAEGKVSHIFVSGNYTVYIRYAGSEIDVKQFPRRYDAFSYIGSRANFHEVLAGITYAQDATPPTVSFDNPSKNSFWTSLIIPLIGMVVLVVVIVWIYRSSQGANNKALNFGRTKARLNPKVKTRFSDVAGADEEKEELQEIVDFLKNPEKFKEIGARIPKGVLLVGPPGTGKTLFAKAVAGEANVNFFSISGSDFVEMFVGVGASRVRDLFEQAKKNKPSIVFIDEIDAVGRQRGAGLGGGNDEREQTLNQLLVNMDGFETEAGVIIMAATNRVDILDPALMRPGRFDRQIYVHIPDVKGREAILRVHARNKPLASEVDFKNIARLTSGFTGADIENLLNEAAILAARANRKLIKMSDISEAINKVIAGPQKRSRLVTETDKRITAYHEAGHAIVAKVLPHCEAHVHEVSIIPRGAAGGYTITLPDNDNDYASKNQLLDTIAMIMGGRAAEEIVIKDISTGASSDIQRASGIARKMVTEWGMSERLGAVYLGTSQEIFLGRDFQSQVYYSEKIASEIDAEVKDIVETALNRALAVLNEHRGIMENMVKLLYERETIFKEEIDLLFEGKSVAEILAYLEAKESKPKAAAPQPAPSAPAPAASEAPTSETPAADESANPDSNN
ncbi:MAG TPA: ATP-dependent zinc metalloprotease FtsH [Eubacteriales bacterium]|nr:ATP-dependent zinc metalloprotease FtsH [Clostridia bacterium]HRR90098.1 ATP-dependent zinc metalloprotease FtsH [Eubacteriales bacterium]HRU84645.1 ATP-dependent zinc metalloprotease FtsH [Eubacteriales bacterium]